MWYDVAPGDVFHVTLIELDDIAVAVMPVGTAGGDVVAEAGGLDNADVPALFAALIS